MHFKRRTPLSFSRRCLNHCWPRMGLRRLVRYYILLIKRLRDHPDQIARGIAIGAAVCFSPLPGTHFIQAIALGYLLRGNILAALIANWFGNPWTYPFLWFISYQVGARLFHLFGWHVTGLHGVHSLDQFWDIFIQHPLGLMLPWTVGGIVVGIIIAPIVFYTVRPIIERHQKRKA